MLVNFYKLIKLWYNEGFENMSIYENSNIQQLLKKLGLQNVIKK